MHNQVLVIYPQGKKLEEIMYPYQEVDKYQSEKLNDERCQWFLTISEDEIPRMEVEIEKYLLKHQRKYLEVLQYRSEHSYEKWKKEYGNGYTRDCLNSYIHYTDRLNEFNEIKKLRDDNPKKIAFLKEYGSWAMDIPTYIYIKGKGFGFFHNPYQIWDYYGVVNESRFPSDVNFLIANDGAGYNRLLLDVLDVDRTIENIHDLTRVWEYIIYCKDNPKNSRIYTIDDIRFDDDWNKHCLVDDLESVLRDIKEENYNKGYMITALDFHW